MPLQRSTDRKMAYLTTHPICHYLPHLPTNLLICRSQVKPEEVPSRVAGLQSELKAATKEVAELKSQLAVAKSQVGRQSWTVRSIEWALLWLVPAGPARLSLRTVRLIMSPTLLPMRCIPCACAMMGLLHYPQLVHTLSALFHTGPGCPGCGVSLQGLQGTGGGAAGRRRKGHAGSCGAAADQPGRRIGSPARHQDRGRQGQLCGVVWRRCELPGRTRLGEGLCGVESKGRAGDMVCGRKVSKETGPSWGG